MRLVQLLCLLGWHPGGGMRVLSSFRRLPTLWDTFCSTDLPPRFFSTRRCRLLANEVRLNPTRRRGRSSQSPPCSANAHSGATTVLYAVSSRCYSSRRMPAFAPRRSFLRQALPYRNLHSGFSVCIRAGSDERHEVTRRELKEGSRPAACRRNPGPTASFP